MMQLPGWFRALLVLVLLALCVETCWYAVSTHQLAAERIDLTGKLEVSRQRERKQQFEYDRVSEELPLAYARLAELQPQTDAAQAREAELRAQRKALRTEISSLKQQLDELRHGNAPKP